jgi:hypothetical protein
VTILASNVRTASRVSIQLNSRDYNADQFLVGHTKVRCKEPLVEEDAGEGKGNNAGGRMDNFGGGGNGGFDSGFCSAAPAADGGWN